MLFIIGLGLSPQQITMECMAVVRSCQKAYIEDYTSQFSSGSLQELETLAGKQFVPLSRKQVEEDFGQVLAEAKQLDVCLAVFGNPLDATTHNQLLLDAKQAGVEARILPGVGIFSLVSVCGLDRYKFGRTTSIVFHEDGFEPESFYDVILENKQLGLHTLCLLDIKKEESKLMSIRHAVSLLESIEERREKNVLGESIMIGLAGLGSTGQQVKAGTMEHLKACDFIPYPQSLIVCGKLNEKEMEGLRAFAGLE